MNFIPTVYSDFGVLLMFIVMWIENKTDFDESSVENVMSVYRINSNLTPKGPLVPMGDKPVLDCFVWSHIIFRFSEFFSPNASCSKLRMSTNFMMLGATDQKLWVFEVFG